MARKAYKAIATEQEARIAELEARLAAAGNTPQPQPTGDPVSRVSEYPTRETRAIGGVETSYRKGAFTITVPDTFTGRTSENGPRMVAGLFGSQRMRSAPTGIMHANGGEFHLQLALTVAPPEADTNAAPRGGQVRGRNVAENATNARTDRQRAAAAKRPASRNADAAATRAHADKGANDALAATIAQAVAAALAANR